MLVCSSCETAFPVNCPRWRCECGGYLVLAVSGMFSLGDLARRPMSLWRKRREALGIEDASQIVTLGEGFTPLADATLGGFPVKLKLDFLCPTGSYKDRGSAVMITKLKDWGVKEILEDLRQRRRVDRQRTPPWRAFAPAIFIFRKARQQGRRRRFPMYGARLIKVSLALRADTARAAWDAANETFYASHNWSPYFLAGMKTAAYEIAEQSLWNPPDWIITPVGGGGLLAGLYLGFSRPPRRGHDLVNTPACRGSIRELRPDLSSLGGRALRGPRCAAKTDGGGRHRGRPTGSR